MGTNSNGDVIYMLCTDRLLGCLQFKPDPFPHKYTSYNKIEASEATAGKDAFEAILREPGSATLTDNEILDSEQIPFENVIDPEVE